MTDATQPDYRTLLKRSLKAIEALEAKLAVAEQVKTAPIAVVGMACRFPGHANDLASFWKLLEAGVDAVTVVPPHRWDAEALYDPNPDAVTKSYTKWGAFIDDVETFDAAFFGISPREAVSLDPQQRLLLEVAWEALEHAGIAPSSLSGSRAGVFIGMSTSDYANLIGEEVGARYGDAYTAAGVAHSIASGRLSYFLDIHGPNFAVDTACSSSIVALHSAILSLRNGETGLAIAGGVNLTLSSLGTVLTSRARMMSFDGRCKTFDESADGYVRGEGCGLLVLKRLADAQREGDRVLAVLRGSAINQDGRSSGLTAPNGTAQVAVIRDALLNAGLEPNDIGVIEAHGTGTSLGDPIEMKALGTVFGDRLRRHPLIVGSVKTNIGHLEAASGVAGIIKMILALQHRVIPPHLHFRNPNPLIPWDDIPIKVPTVARPWQTPDGVLRRAGVSSFGFSGTNSHVIIEEAPPGERVPRTEKPARTQLLVLSAQNATALRAQAEQYRTFLSAEDAPPLRDITFTATTGRSHLAERLVVVAPDAETAARHLGQWLNDEPAPQVHAGRFSSGTAPEVAFLFSGQGAQYPGMARELYESEPVFRSTLDACAAITDPLLTSPLLPVIMGEASVSESLDDTAFTQPALFAVEYALAQLWKSWGVEPALVMGHSVGEYVAACLAGVFSLEDGLRLIAARGRLMSALPRDGAMVAVFAARERVAEALRGFEADVDIAAVNGPQNTVISGRATVVEAIVATLVTNGVEYARLNVSHAFHSPLMEPMLDEFERIASTVDFRVPSIGLVSNVTGRMAGAEVTTAAYWRQHVRRAVLFTDSIATLHAEHMSAFVEIGPTPVLIGMAQRCVGGEGATWLASLRKNRSDRESMLESAGRLHLCGQPLAWTALNDSEAQRVHLPTYPFQRERYWFEARKDVSPRVSGSSTGHPLLGARMASPLHLFQSTLSINRLPWLSDHRIFGAALLPGAGFIEVALAAAREVLGTDAVALGNVSLRESLTIPETGEVTVQVIVTPRDDESLHVQVFSAIVDEKSETDGDTPSTWRSHLEATASRGSAAPSAIGVPVLPEVGRVQKDVSAYYTHLAAQGADYGEGFRSIVSMTRSHGQVLGRIVMPAVLGEDRLEYQIHPAMLDAAIQMVGIGLPWADEPKETDPIFLPIGLGTLQVFKAAPTEAWCHVYSIQLNAQQTSCTADFRLLDAEGRVIAAAEGFELHRVSRADLMKGATQVSKPEWMLEVDWQLSSLDDAPTTIAGTWLIVSDGAPITTDLAARLRSRGADVVVAAPDDDCPQSGRWAGVISLGAPRVPDPVDLETLTAAHARRVGHLLQLVPSIAERADRLFIVTEGAQHVGDVLPNLVDAPVWGLGNVIASEYPSLRVTRIDLEPAPLPDAAHLVASAIVMGDGEDRVALRGGQRYVARLAQGALLDRDALPPRRLEITERGTLEHLQLAVVPRETPGVGEVEIQVHATGLNFRDVLNALGMYPGDPGPLGNECAGVVTAIGEDVDDLRVGDEVVAMIDRSFATFVIAPAIKTVRKPAGLSFSEAATIPVTFLTAQYALETLGGMKRGDKVLIHAATGGVGMAAMQLARRAGAIVLGTAGTPAKRKLAQALGAQYVSDSRSLAFVEDFQPVTADSGVDIVLNSLAGEFIPASLGMLRPGGHFIEIGKTGIWDAQTVARSFPAANYHPLYLGEIAQTEPTLVRTMLQRLMDDFASGALTALPEKLYPLERAEDAFRFMSHGLHTGKIVITQQPTPQVRTDASYLITGGLGGLGLACARWLAGLGARSVVLVGRRGPDTEAQVIIDDLRSRGVLITVVAADISVAGDVATMLTGIAETLPPLRGILHAAGIVDDGMLAEQTIERFERVMRPKVQGTWHLHEQTRSLAIDFFVMFSSGAAVLGSPGQANYAAANSFMDAIAYHRRARGLHGVSINWGSWSDVGMASGLSEGHHRRWASLGLAMIPPENGVRMLQEILQRATSPNVAAMPLDRNRIPKNAGVFYTRLISASPKKSSTASGESVDVIRRVQGAPEDDRPAIVAAFLTDQIARVLALPSSSRARPEVSLMDIGLDSLTAMELRNRVQAVLGVKLSIADLLKGASINELVGALLPQLEETKGSPPPATGEFRLSASADEPPPSAPSAPKRMPTGTWTEGEI